MMRKQLSLTTALRQFFRQEDGVAFITFGIFVALLGILLLAANIDFGRNYGSQTEIRAKLEENSVPLTEDFNELWLKGAQCRNNPDTTACKENADEKQRVFMKPLNNYFDAAGIKKDAITADMMEYIKRAFNEDLGKLRFQPIEPPVVVITCNDKYFSPGRLYLTYKAKAPQFDTFFKGSSGKDIEIEVERLTKVPCSFDDMPNHSTPVCAGTGCSAAGEMCTHGNKPRKGSNIEESTEFTNSVAGPYVNGASVVSVVNFVMPLDANSNRDMGGTNQFLSRFANSVRNLTFTLGNQDKIAAGLTMGNYPMQGGGAPTCKDNGSNLPTSGSCFDESSEVAKIDASSTGTAGFQNMSRKDALNGEFRAQYTRRCAPEDSVWTYETQDRGSCVERGYGEHNHHEWFYGSDDKTDAQLIAEFGSTFGNPAIGLSLCKKDERPEFTIENFIQGPWVDRVNDSYIVADSNCKSDVPAGKCRRFSIAVQCVGKGEKEYRVFGGKWTPACRSVELGNDANRTYTPPSQLVRFNAELVADLEGKQLDASTTPVISLGATLAQALTPTSMRSVDARRLNQIDELHPLNVKNTERSFNWACDSGPVDATGKHVNNGGNLSTPYGERVDSSRSLLEYDAVTKTSLANNANDGKGCSIPALPTNSSGQMESTIATYDLRFTRTNCPTEPCDVPEGMYAISMKPGRQLQGTNTLPNQNLRIPQNGLTTAWIPEVSARDPNDGNKRIWAWDRDPSGPRLGNVLPGQNNRNECPAVGGSAPTCVGGWVTASDGQQYCRRYQYATVQYNNSGVCGADGSNCPNVAKYILQDSDDTQPWPAISAEKLNISSVGLERRQKPDTSGQAIPYMCTLDKGETQTSQRSGLVAIAGGTYDNNPQCNWRNGDPFFCSTRSNGSPLSAEQVEQFFIDSANVGGGQGLGIFALNANNFGGSTTIPIGDDMEEWRTDGLSTNFKSRNLTKTGEVKSTYDTGLGIMPVQVQNEEVVRYNNADLPPDNMEIRNDGNQLERVLTEIARGYSSFQILNHHTGNQCALIKAGLRQLWGGVDTMAGHTTSKFLVYVGSLPNKGDFTEEQAAHLANSSSGNSGDPGLYNSTLLKLQGKPTLSSSFDSKDSKFNPGALILEKCIASADDDKSTTPFVVTTLPSDADEDDVKNILDAMRLSTVNTTNEACKRPFCLLSTKDGDFNGHKGPGEEGQNIMTPETCAAKLWKCISPSTTKF